MKFIVHIIANIMLHRISYTVTQRHQRGKLIPVISIRDRHLFRDTIAIREREREREREIRRSTDRPSACSLFRPLFALGSIPKKGMSEGISRRIDLLYALLYRTLRLSYRLAIIGDLEAFFSVALI